LKKKCLPFALCAQQGRLAFLFALTCFVLQSEKNISNMTFKDIAAISGRPGLFRVLKPTRNGMIVETIDEKKQKMVVDAKQRVSILKEISVFTTGADEAVLLEEVFFSIHKQYGQPVEINVKDNAALAEFLEGVLPNYDREKVYPSDMKKMVIWYNMLVARFPELFIKPVEEAKEETPAAEGAEETTEQA
jgi:hypothetical protein